MKRHLLLSAVCVLLASGAAQAQTEPGHYVVLFALGKATLDSTATATIASAAQEFQRTGSANIQVAGHTDTSGNADYNQALSERREQAVADELTRLGVPASAINATAYGETQPAVPTGDGVPEAQNRRVDIVLAQPAPPPPQPAPAPAPAPQPQVAETPPPLPPAGRGLLSGGLFYGYNFEDKGGGHSQLGGINLSLDYAVIPWLSVGLEQAGFYQFDANDDGLGGRSAASIDLVGNGFGNSDFVPHIGGNIGYLYGDGIDDDAFAGPEIGVQAGIFDAKVAYDIPFNRDFDEGIIAMTFGVGFKF
jgi:hypothetical protein